MNKSNEKPRDLSVYPVKIDESNMDIVDKFILPIPFFLVILGRVKAVNQIY